MPRPFRFLHTSDWHLGHELHGHHREEEHDAFLRWLLDAIEEHGVDALVMTGDVYDVANPAVTATQRFYGFLREATVRCPNLHIVVLGGNHDSAHRINLPGALLGKGRVHLIGNLPRCEGALDFERLLVPLPGEGGETMAWVAAIPFCRPGDLGTGDLASLYAEVLDVAHARCGGLPIVVTGHLHVAGGDVSTDSERRVVIGGEEAEAATLFDGRAAYVALGHLHRPQEVSGTTTIRYAGSPFPMSASERRYRHSVSLVDLPSNGGAAGVEELRVPRHAPFLALPDEDALPIEEVEALLAAYNFGHPATPGSFPFLEVAVAVTRPEPGLWARVSAALEGRPVRLTRVRQVRPKGAGDGSIAALEEALARAFAQLLIETETAA
jgi:exonuclease SbcD